MLAALARRIGLGMIAALVIGHDGATIGEK